MAARPFIEGDDEKDRKQIKSVRPYGLRGQIQNGIDLVATLENGEIWVFQCKHHSKWTKQKTEQAIAKCGHEASRKFLLVTCDVGDPERAPLGDHPDWTLWDRRKITQEFLALQPDRVAAGILYRCFGPGWDTKFFRVPGVGPLLTADAFFKPWRDGQRDFHHNLALVGRKEWVERLDEFVGRKYRVFLLTGKGGAGKSKILSDWSRGVSGRNPGTTLLFASRVSESFEEHLSAAGERVVVVLDDAHQESGLRKKLFQASVRLDGVKLVLSLRPGPNEAVKQELIDAGFDTSEIEEAPHIGSLGDEEALKLAEEALGDSHSSYAQFLYEVSRDCPLIAVVGGGLIGKGKAGPADLASHAEFRSLVFERLGRQAEAVRGEFGGQGVDEFLALVALLSPVENAAEFRREAASILGKEWSEHRVSVLIDRLDESGVLLAGQSGLRITPDLLSDEIAYKACYDRQGRTTGFARLVVERFAERSLESMARHLAETEWRAAAEHDRRSESILAPIVGMFRSKFEAASFVDRGSLLDQWAQIAALRPRETIEFVDLALNATSAPKDSDLRLFGDITSAMDTYPGMLRHVPALLRAVGRHHREHVHAALERLWMLARDRDDDAERDQNHPLAAMAGICKYEEWKPIEISREALGWVEEFFDRTDWLSAKPHPQVVLNVLLEPFLSPWIDKTIWMRRQVRFQVAAVSLDTVRDLRGRVLVLCARLLKRKGVVPVVGIVHLADEAAAKLRPPHGGSVPPRLEAAWLPERLKGLDLFGRILRETSQPAVHLAVRKKLLRFLRYEDDDEFLARCRELLAAVPDDLRMRVVRAVFSNDDDEFDEPYTDDREEIRVRLDRVRKQWTAFLEVTASELLERFPTASGFAGFLDSVAADGAGVGWEHPRFRELLSAVIASRGEAGRGLVDLLLANPSHPLAHDFDLLVQKTTSADDPRERLGLYRRALESGSSPLAGSAIQGLSWWRSEVPLPDEAWMLLDQAAASDSPEIVWALAGFLDFHARKPEPRDWELLSRLPLSERHAACAARILDAFEHMVDSEPEAAGAIPKVLDKLVSFRSLRESRLDHELSQIAAHAPGEFFRFLVKRYRAWRERRFGPEYEALPGWLGEVPLGDLAESDCGPLIDELGDHLLSEPESDFQLLKLLRIAGSGSISRSNVLDGLLAKADSAEKLERLLRLLRTSPRPVVRSRPEWMKRCLTKARGFGSGVYDDVRRALLSNCLVGSRSFTNGEPDESTLGHVEALERLAHQYAADADLGSLFAEAASRERQSLKIHRQEFLNDLADG